jgi:ectoine hydroxylase-related dioxygenase (phytanoyl-CoA dioxygenase family)
MAEDLSLQHRRVGNLFPQPQSAKEWERFRVSDEQVAFFREHGYLAGVRALDDAQVDALRAELEEISDPKHPRHHLYYEFHSNESRDPSMILFHALGAWRIAPAFHDVLWNPAFLMPASQLLEGAVRFWHDQVFWKPAKSGGVVAWHQDYSYWTRTRPLAHLTCWIGLDDSTRENGCLHYVPGSHRWNLLPRTALADNMDAVQSVLTEEQKAQFKPVAIELKRGECSFHHAMLVHGSFANRTAEPRRAVVLNVVRDGVESASDEPLLEGVPPIPAGEKLGGRFFPLLFDPRSVTA